MKLQPIAFRTPTVTRYLLLQILAVPLALGLAAWFAHDSGLDFRIQDAFYDPALGGFPWRRTAWLETIGHQSLKIVPIALLVIAVAAAIASRWIVELRPWRRLLLIVAAALALGPIIVTQLKQVTAPPCPWDLKQYGGYAEVATRWFVGSAVESGRCLPSGHAGAGFSLLALYFAGWASGYPRWRWYGLAIGASAGMLFGVIRMIQGAHFLSHVLWAALVCWLVAGLVFMPWICRRLPSGTRIQNLRGETPSSAMAPITVPASEHARAGEVSIGNE